MKKTRFFPTAVYTLSAVAFCLQFSPVGMSFMLKLAFAGLVLACFCFTALLPERTRPLAWVLAAPAELCLFGRFYHNWLPSTMLRSVADRLSLNPELLILVFSVLLCAAALPFAALLISRVLPLLKGTVLRPGCRELAEELKPASLRTLGRGCALTLGNVLGAALLGLGVMVLVFALPMGRTEENITRSAAIFEEEGTYPVLSDACLSKLDNFTDALMLLESADTTEDTVLHRAMNVYRGYYNYEVPLDPAAALVAHYSDGIPYTESVTYARYWHGYLLFVKPLLALTDYGTIRILNGAAQAALLCVLLFLFRKRGLSRLILPWLLSVGMLMPLALAKSLQFSCCYYLMTLGSILLLAVPGCGEARGRAILFLNLGIATAFFDFLTYPLAVFSVPMIVALGCDREKDSPVKLAGIVRGGFMWGVGYAGMWSSKWILSSLLTDSDAIGDAIQSIAERTSRSGMEAVVRTPADAIEKNFTNFLDTPVWYLVFLFVFACTILAVRRRKGAFGAAPSLLPYFFTAALPLLWYSVLVNHSVIHSYFTCKECVISCFALLAAAAEYAAPASVPERGGAHEK